jgi:hypothetical protein
MGDVVSLAAKRREMQAKAPPKSQETSKEPSIEERIERIRASIVRINTLIQELKEMNHDATNCRR